MQQTLFEKQNDQNPQLQAVNVQRLVSKPLLLHGDCLEKMKFERTIDRQGRKMIAEGLLIIAFWLVMMTVFMVLAV